VLALPPAGWAGVGIPPPSGRGLAVRSDGLVRSGPGNVTNVIRGGRWTLIFPGKFSRLPAGQGRIAVATSCGWTTSVDTGYTVPLM
jgi:hypothetical protein